MQCKSQAPPYIHGTWEKGGAWGVRQTSSYKEGGEEFYTALLITRASQKNSRKTKYHYYAASLHVGPSMTTKTMHNELKRKQWELLCPMNNATAYMYSISYNGLWLLIILYY